MNRCLERCKRQQARKNVLMDACTDERGWRCRVRSVLINGSVNNGTHESGAARFVETTRALSVFMNRCHERCKRQQATKNVLKYTCPDERVNRSCAPSLVNLF